MATKKQKDLSKLLERLKKKYATAYSTNTNPVEIGLGDLQLIIEFLIEWDNELKYRSTNHLDIVWSKRNEN